MNDNEMKSECGRSARWLQGLAALSVFAATHASAVTETFNSYANGTALTAVGGGSAWWTAGTLYTVVGGGGVNASAGLSNDVSGSSIFNWKAQPFQWSTLAVGTKVAISLDFQSSASGNKFDDDRVGWTVNADSATSSANQFALQLDVAGMECYWDSNRTVLNPLSGVKASTWYRFRVEYTKLTDTSAAIVGTLIELDATGNPTGTPYVGTIPDTSAAPYSAPTARFTNATGQWPTFKNYNATGGNADNASFTVTAPGNYRSYAGAPIAENFDALTATGTVLTPLVGWDAGTFSPVQAAQPGPGNTVTTVTDTSLLANDGTFFLANSNEAATIGNLGITGSSDRALGGMPKTVSGDMYHQLAIKNNSGSPIASFALSYTGEQWTNAPSSNADSLTVWFSDNNATSGFVTMGTGFTFTALKVGGTTVLDGNAVGNRTAVSGTFTPATPIAAGNTFYIRWYDRNDAAQDHVLALDDLTVTPAFGSGNQAPTVAITSPANNATVTASFTIAATAADSDGTITSVAFYDGTTLLNTDTSSPYSYAWNGAAVGSHALTAVALDNGGLTTTSAVVNVVVPAPPGPGGTLLAQNFSTDPVNYILPGNSSPFRFDTGPRYWAKSDTPGLTVNAGITGSDGPYLGTQNNDGGTVAFTADAPSQIDFIVAAAGYSNLKLSLALAGLPGAEDVNFIRGKTDNDGDGTYETTLFDFKGTNPPTNVAYNDAVLGALSAAFKTFSNIALPTPTAADGMLRLRLESFNDTDGFGEATGIDSIVISGTPPVPPAQAEYVIVISVDGLGGTYLNKLFNGTATGGPYAIPNFTRLKNEGASTLYGHCDNNNWETLPNHTSIVTARPRDGTAGHNWSSNGDPGVGQTIHSNKGSYVVSVFDVAHDNGLRTGMYANKTKFSLFDNNATYPGGGSYNATYGALDITGVDNGRDKVDNTYINTALGGIIVDTFITQQKTASPNRYAFLHINETDAYGHSSGWGSVTWNQQAVVVDTMLGKIFKLIEQDVAALKGKTTIILTADHGNQDNPPTGADRYAVPFYVWGPGVPAGADLYTLNAGKRQVAASYPMMTYSGIQPIRNAEANNLALDLLGLGPIPGSMFAFTQDLVVTAPPAADPSVTLGLTGSPLAEAAGVATVTATLSVAHTLPVTVNLAFAGTATATSDYTASSNSIVIAAGSTSGTLILTAVQDTLYENPDETILVDIATVVNGTESGTQQVTATIAGDDAAPVGVTLLSENFDSMGPAGTAPPVNWITGSYTVVQSRVLLDATPSTLKNDPLFVDNGSSNTLGRGYNYGTTGAADRAIGHMGTTSNYGDSGLQGVIVNNTGAPITSLTIQYAGEQWRKQQSNAPTPEKLRVYISNANNGGYIYLPALDFVAPQNTPGDTTELALDGNLAANRTVLSSTVNLLAIGYPGGAIAPNALFYVTWHDWNDDATRDHALAVDDVVISSATAATPPSVTLGLTGSPLAEAAGVATVTATLSAAHTLPVTVNLAFAGTATATSDYTASSNSIVIAAGSTSGTLILTAVQDTLYENPDETILVDIATVVNGTESGAQQVTATIAGDDAAPIFRSYTGTALADNFDGLGPAGTTLPGGWDAGHFIGTGTGGFIQQGTTGGSGATTVTDALVVDDGSHDPNTTPMIANFGTAGAADRALGSFARTNPRGDQFLQLAIKNDTTSALASFTLSYRGEEWRSGNSAAQQLSVWYGNTDPINGFVAMGSGFNFTSPNNTGSNVKIDGNAAGNFTQISGTFTPATPIAPGSTFYIRWYDINDDGIVDDFFAIDDVTVTPSTGPAPVKDFTAYNDCSSSAGNPANTTEYRGNATTSGPLKDFATGTPLPVTLSITANAVSYDGTGGVGGFAVGTDAYNTFNGKVVFDDVIWYTAAFNGFWMDARFTGLDPAKEYEFATSVNRGGSGGDYGSRLSMFTISDIDSAANSSTAGVTVNSPTSVTFCSGINGTNGYVARWTKIKCGADGAFTVRVEDGGGVGKGYAFDGLMLRESTPVPPNDNFANAIELLGATGNLSGNNTLNATFEVDEPECFYPETTNTVWFKWTCTKAGSFTLRTQGSKNTSNTEWDAVVGIYTGSSLATLTQLIEQDTGLEETVNLAVTPGTYYIQMGGWPNPVPDAASDIALNWLFEEPPPPLDGFIAYNDCTASAGNPANTTLYRGQPDGAGFLKDFATGTILPVTLTVASANVNYVGTGGPMPAAGTDAYNTFNGKVLFDSVAYYAAGWWMEARFTGLDPAKEYEFATSVNRGGSASDYALRLSKFTISDADSLTNSSTVGVTVNAPESVTFCTGINGATGYVARWTKIRCGADGDFTVRVEDGGSTVLKGYAMDGLMLRETTPPNQAPVFAGYAVSGAADQGLAIYPSKILALASDPDGDALSLTQVFGPSAQGGTVALADSVNYTPPAGYAGTDTFNVEITDAKGASVRGTVTVTLTAAPTGTGALGQNLTEFELVGGAAEMVFRGIPGRSYTIQRSTDMVNWGDLATLVAGPDGKILFTDPTPPMPQGYYRTRSN